MLSSDSAVEVRSERDATSCAAEAAPASSWRAQPHLVPSSCGLGASQAPSGTAAGAGSVTAVWAATS